MEGWSNFRLGASEGIEMSLAGSGNEGYEESQQIAGAIVRGEQEINWK